MRQRKLGGVLAGIAFVTVGVFVPVGASAADVVKVDNTDDYFACLVGRAAVAIEHGAKDEAALQTAYKICKPTPAFAKRLENPGEGDPDPDGFSDAVNLYVTKLGETVSR